MHTRRENGTSISTSNVMLPLEIFMRSTLIYRHPCTQSSDISGMLQRSRRCSRQRLGRTSHRRCCAQHWILHCNVGGGRSSFKLRKSAKKGRLMVIVTKVVTSHVIQSIEYCLQTPSNIFWYFWNNMLVCDARDIKMQSRDFVLSVRTACNKARIKQWMHPDPPWPSLLYTWRPYEMALQKRNTPHNIVKKNEMSYIVDGRLLVTGDYCLKKGVVCGIDLRNKQYEFCSDNNHE